MIIARKRFSLTCVKKEMIFKIGLLGETSVADIALEGPVAVVDISMCLEITCTAPPIIILVMFICYYA